MGVPQLKYEIKQFAEKTSLHGIAGIINPKHSSWIRLAWLLFFLLMLATYLFMLNQTLIEYFQYPVVTNVEYRTTDSIAFPSVTICNYNIHRYSAIVKDNTALYVYKSTPTIKGLPQPSEHVNMSEVDWVALNREWAHQPEDMYLECAFDSQQQTPCNVNKEVTWTMSPDGYCHTFNSQELIYKYGVKVTTRSGGNYGLTILVNLETYDYLFPISNASGIQVLVHDPHVLPDVKEMGFAVSAGTETLAAIKKTQVKRLPEPYAKAPNLCENSHTPGYKNPLKYFSHYSLSACLRECRIKNQLSICGCAGHIYGGVNVTICPYLQFVSCSFAATDQYDADPSIEAGCGCLPTCEETIYDVSVSSSGMPNDYSRETLAKSLKIPPLNSSNIDKNIISLKIFFLEMRYTLIEQQSMYTPTSLFGELGGQLGLCLGASILTIVELLQLLGVFCAQLCKKHSEKTTIVHAHPQHKHNESI